MLRALNEPRRRDILRLTWRGEMAAGAIHRALGDVTFGAVSQHLRILKEAGLVSARRDGRRRLYAARREDMGPLADWLEAMWSNSLGNLKALAEGEHARSGARRGKKKDKKNP